MIYTSLAVFVLSASAAVSPLSKLVHLHPHATDTRVSLTIHNDASMFQDVAIAGRVYTVLGNQGLTVKAPVGTIVYAASATNSHHRGDVLAELTQADNNHVVDVR